MADVVDSPSMMVPMALHVQYGGKSTHEEWVSSASDEERHQTHQLLARDISPEALLDRTWRTHSAIVLARAVSLEWS